MVEMSFKDDKVGGKWKFFMSVLLGLAGFIGSYYSITFHVGQFHISLVWAYLFPLVAAMAYGPKHGFVAGVLGLTAFIPFLLWPDNGWANILNASALLLWLVWQGYASQEYKKEKKWYWHPLYVQGQYFVLYAVVYSVLDPMIFSFNPTRWAPDSEVMMPREILYGIILKENVHCFLMVVLAQFVLITNQARWMLKLPLKTEFKHNGTLFLYTILAFVIITAVWLTVKITLVDGMSWKNLLALFTIKEVPYLFVIFASCVVSGFIMAKYSGKLLSMVDTLNESERFNKQLLSISPIGLTLCRLDGSFVETNPAFQKITGRSAEELRGLKFYDITPKKYEELESHAIKVLAETGSYGPYEKEFLRKDGSLVPILIMGASVEHDGEFFTWSSIEDISERKKARQDLSETNERLSVLIEAIPDAIFFKDSEGRWLVINEPAKKLFKLNGYPWQGKTDAQLGDERPEFKEVHRICSEDDEKAWDLRKAYVADEYITDHLGVKRQFEVTKVPLFHSDGRRKALVVIGADVTERRLQEEELKEALSKAESSDRLKTAFMNNISHEIRTPLNSITGFGNLLMDHKLSQADKELYLEHIQSSSNRLINTITDYMDISLLVSGNQDVRKRLFDPVEMLQKVFDDFKKTCKESKISLMLEVLPEKANLLINSDQELLLKVMRHLVGNAVKFTANGQIVFGLDATNYSLVFFVKDTGIGIAKEAQKVVFDNFVQENSSTTRQHEGSGLGLSIVKGIVELLGGTVWFDSTKGKGSSFYFSIHTDGVVTEQVGLKKELKKVVDNPLILIAEDEASNSFFIEKLLNRNGFDTLIVTDGIQAVAICQENRAISLVLMDLKMPDLNGFEATREIKTFRPELPIIAITAFAMSNDEGKALDAGCDDYISKPFTQENLLAKLGNFGLFPGPANK